jgi:nucleoside-diphosphate-sugar epimerase
MIIGNGQIAKSFLSYKNDNRVLIFASGVSNSQESNLINFNRERLLLKSAINNNKDKIFVYFSSCSIYDLTLKDSSYVEHKIEMENIIAKNTNNYYIFRLPQVVGSIRTISTNLVSFLFTSIFNNTTIDIYQKSTRNLIGLKDVFSSADFLIRNNKYINEITNIATPYNIPLINIIKMIEEITGLSLSYNTLDIGYSYDINIDKLHNLDVDLDIFASGYLYDVLQDYNLRFRAEYLENDGLLKGPCAN